MALARREYFELSGHPKCQCCENRFPKEFADRCLGWSGGPEEYTLNELIEYCGVDWKNYDKRGQWYMWNDDFICPECAQKLIDNGEAKLITCYRERWTTCDYDELPEKEKQFAKPHKTMDGRIMGSEIRIPYNVLTKVRKKRK